jgi:hypothetical protein
MNNLLSFSKLLYAAALVTGCCFVFGCENDEKVLNDWTKIVVMKEEARNVESFLSDGGKMKAKLKAPLMYRVITDTNYVEFPNTLHVDFYNDSTRIDSWLDSKYGKYFETLNKVYLRDSVVVINMNGDTLKCPDLWWDQNTKLFHTDKYAQYHTKDNQYYGSKGMEATQDLKRVTFNVGGGRVKVPENGFPNK